MSDHPSLSLGELLKQLEQLERQIASAEQVARAKVEELRRQARAQPHRRRRNGSRDTTRYAIGGAVTMLAGEVDAMTLLGLFAQIDMMLTWMASERLARGPAPFSVLLRAILDDPRKAAWCRRWGALVEWAHRKALYDANVSSFERSGRTGTHEPWRRHAVTDDQADLVETLCRLLEKNPPDLRDKGSAYEWIKEHGGNPAYWAPPTHPNSWSDDDVDT